MTIYIRECYPIRGITRSLNWRAVYIERVSVRFGEGATVLPNEVIGESRVLLCVADNNRSKIRWYIHLLSKRSRAVKILAVYHVTAENNGRYTAGIDGVKMIRGRKEINEPLRLSLLNDIDISKKPSPIRRVYIPKANGKKRPIGIPTIADRIIQDTLRMTLEPITEYYASDNSYGFRPKRCCHDGIAHLFTKLSPRRAYQWIIEGDISGCFDSISHDHILNTLRSWNVSGNIRKVIRKMLRSKILSDDKLHDVEEGTPQGSLLSPMMANVALTAFDDYCYKEYGKIGYKKKEGKWIKYHNSPIIRYADDFVIVCKSEQEAIGIKEKIATFLKANIGLELSSEKTKITHISEGFDFLGYNIRKYCPKNPAGRSKLLIKPEKEKVINFLKQTQQIVNSNKTAKQESIIRMLNPKLQGFGMYYRFTVSQQVFEYINNNLWKKLWRWAKRRHPKKPRKWIADKYFSVREKKKWVFKDETGKEIINIASIPIVRFIKIESGKRVYGDDKDTKEYWERRVYTNALSQVYSVKVEKLMTRQKGICPCCDPITKEDIAEKKVHAHHMLPRSEGGTDGLNNLTLLHLSCHKLAHSVLTRKEMAYWMKKKLIRQCHMQAIALFD